MRKHHRLNSVRTCGVSRVIGSGLIKSTLPGQRRGRQKPNSRAPAGHNVWRCAPEVLQRVLKALSMRQRSLYRRLLKLNGCFLLQRLGMTGLFRAGRGHRAIWRCHRPCRRASFSACSPALRPDSHALHLQRPLASASACIFVRTICFVPLWRRSSTFAIR
jgi:hypothetical protein